MIRKTGSACCECKEKTKSNARCLWSITFTMNCSTTEHLWSPAQKNDPIFPIDAGTPISNNRVLKMIKERCQAAGITQRITPHVLRHCFATDMYHAGVPLFMFMCPMTFKNRHWNNLVCKEDFYGRSQ